MWPPGASLITELAVNVFAEDQVTVIWQSLHCGGETYL